MLRARLSARRLAGPVLYAACTTILLLRTAPGRVGVDTKQYLFVDPGRLLGDASSMWQPGVAFGTVPHQNIGFLWPMGPFFWLGEQAGFADWVTQRLWIAALLTAAGLGVRWLAHEFGITAVGAWVAGLVYAWGPFSLGYVHRTSVLLLPWAGLGFLVVFAGRAVRRGGWRDPAAFALVAGTVGGANATALLLAGLAPFLWVVHLALDPDIGYRRAVRGAARIGVLTAAVSVWWAVALVVQGQYSLNILRYTETIDAVARSTSATEVLRGLGYWLFYGRDRIGPWIEPAPAYQTSTLLLVASFALPFLGIAALVLVRSRYRGYCTTMLVVGVVVAVGAFPWDDPSPLGSLSQALATSTDVGLALRSSTRTVPIIALALSLALGGMVAAVIRRTRPAGWGAGALVCLLAFGAFPPLWQGTLVADDLSRPEDIPAAWIEAIGHVDGDDHGTRILELPGIDLTFHRWGATWEPITPGLTDRPFAARELVPYGGPGSVDLLRALDRRMQEGVIEAEAIAPIARLLGAGDLLVRSDLEYERFRTPRPRILWDVLQRAPGLGTTTAFGDSVPNVAGPELPLLDEIELGTSPDAEHPPPVAAIDVLDVPDILHAAPLDGAVIVAGSGEGLVDAAAAGILDRPGLLVYSATFADDEAALRELLDRGADLLVTDSNRRRAERWRTLRDNTGLTEAADETPLIDDESDARLDLFPTAGSDEQSVTVTSGARATATAYGNPITYTPSERPQLAIDGDDATAWTVGAFTDPRGERLIVELDEPQRIGEVDLLPAPTIGRRVTEVAVRADGKEVGAASFPDTSPSTIDLSGAGVVATLEFEIIDTEPRASAAAPNSPAVGIAEVRIPGLETTESVRVPVDLVRAVDHDLDHRLVYLLSRLRADPSEVVRSDDERTISRIVEVPSRRSFALRGTARIADSAADAQLWALLGQSGPLVTASDSLGGALSSRPWSALDDDPTTSWQTGFGPQEGRWIELDVGDAVTFDRLRIDTLADGRHSVPTVLTVSAGGSAHRVDLPPGGGSATVAFPALTGDRIRVTVEAVEPTVTRDLYQLADIAMPVGVRELAVAGVAPTVRRDELDATCRDDLVAVDGRPTSVRVLGAAADAERGHGLDLESCDDALLLEGEVEITTAEGSMGGIDVDRLALASAVGGGPDRLTTPLGEAQDVRPQLTVLEDEDTYRHVEVDTAGQDTMVVLGENRNDGWTATADGEDLGPSTMVNGYANGWIVPAGERPVDVELTWTPQRRIQWALWASALGAVGCLAIIATTRRRRSESGVATESLPASWTLTAAAALPPRWTVVLVTGSALAAAVTTSVVTGCVVLLLAVVGCRHRYGIAVLAAAALGSLGAAFGSVVVSQRRRRWHADFDWPSHFMVGHRLALAGVVLVGVTVVTSWARRRLAPADEPGSGGARW